MGFGGQNGPLYTPTMNVTVIGMPGVGKSYLGRKLAKRLGYTFIDVDKQMEKRYGKPLQKILDELGDEKFICAEAQEIRSLADVDKTLISPGGSVVYAPEAMELLKKISHIIYLAAPTELIQKRITVQSRGIVGLRDQSFAELHEERKALYEKWADITINADQKSENEIVQEMLDFFGNA